MKSKIIFEFKEDVNGVKLTIKSKGDVRDEYLNIIKTVIDEQVENSDKLKNTKIEKIK